MKRIQSSGVALYLAKKRFFKKVIKTETCWLWTASKDMGGYGVFSNQVFSEKRAHRVSWVIHKGPIPKGFCVLHKCDTRNCVNPDHLFLGTYADNTLDRIFKGRGRGSWIDSI